MSERYFEDLGEGRVGELSPAEAGKAEHRVTDELEAEAALQAQAERDQALALVGQLREALEAIASRGSWADAHGRKPIEQGMELYRQGYDNAANSCAGAYADCATAIREAMKGGE